MINLLPSELKTSYVYAKRNVVLQKWLVLSLGALVGLAALGTVGMLSIRQSEVNTKKQIAAANATFKREKYADTQKEVKDISNNFKLAVKVLSQEVLFSKLIKQIGATIPANASLTQLNINQTTGGIDLDANATDYKTATQVQVNVADPANKIFSKADIIKVGCGNTSSTSERYPCSISLRALFGDNNPYLFINDNKAKR